MLDTILRFFQEGGAFMYPIAVVLVIGLAIAIERFIYLTAAKNSNRNAFDKGLLPILRKRDYPKALKFANDSQAAIAAIMGAGLSRLLNNANRDEIEFAMEEGLMETLPRLEKRTQYLATLANVSTLLGLLGTIIGLIAAFTAVANADPAEKASLLSQSISVAMNTTAFGLMAAIPLLLCHAVLQTKTNEIVDSFEMAGVKLLNMISDKTGQS
ncbi:flagellar motor protein MotA [Oleiphilus sp. HI0081]|jgi:biopolymer transport protein ExbB/TolQ|nr:MULTISPECIES: MotA/TolQ/ExbB proton channel family protein [unclassified Oleiphilus]KZY46486.1 flagellar motor protein MotA [Oleiphilus sp. HI0050]KZY79535.1 flagellar motor protein MotA [Oleiphilus sp. HI0069]KZY84658.1 flagellar motor protein MotA [Oleiphilus sp. HI0068]KZY88892.1 flagellar motor protein MotA [Oleiphilus sp. HI0072]KZZ27372.1 flagellar motor protein MotA [Oleiphilus sp. HI0081]KZZ34186.1 flagellar motor protein MotA [Oleiphilus sp. HI0085]